MSSLNFHAKHHVPIFGAKIQIFLLCTLFLQVTYIHQNASGHFLHSVKHVKCRRVSVTAALVTQNAKGAFNMILIQILSF